MKYFSIPFLALCVVLSMSGPAVSANPPVLYFSDLTSGPKTGLGDGLGSGAIVSIWGVNLGSTQGSSKVYVGDVEAAYVYEWANATQHKGHPSDLYTYHKMQVVMFSVPAGALDGANTIKVSVGGSNSNTLPFTVRAGRIYHCKSTGTDSPGNGSWASPIATPAYFYNLYGLSPLPAAGSILYIGDGITTSAGIWPNVAGTAANPYFATAYPGATVILRSAVGVYNEIYPAWGAGYPAANFPYNHISKVTFHGVTACSNTPYYGRIIATECTQYPGVAIHNVQTGHFTAGQNPGAIGYGNYIHNVGTPGATDSQSHTTYFSNRSGVALAPYDFGWNLLKDNSSNGGIRMYDEYNVGGWTGPVKIHDNVIVNQRGVGLSISCGGSSGYACTNEFQVYNNLIINSGLGPCMENADGPHAVYMHAMALGTASGSPFAPGAQYTVKAYNNTIYGYGDITSNLSLCGISSTNSALSGAVSIGNAAGNTIEWRNNIVVDTKNIPYGPTSGDTAGPNVHTNNLWHNTTSGRTPPSWDTAPINADPKFVNAAANDFHLQETSPCIDAGIGTPIVTRDLFGLLRLTSGLSAIGTSEYKYRPIAPTALRIIP